MTKENFSYKSNPGHESQGAKQATERQSCKKVRRPWKPRISQLQKNLELFLARKSICKTLHKQSAEIIYLNTKCQMDTWQKTPEVLMYIRADEPTRRRVFYKDCLLSLALMPERCAFPSLISWSF